MVDYRIPGTSLSTFQEQDEQRRHTVAKLIEQFESHQYKEQVLQDMSQTQKINWFSKASQKLLKDINETEVFELCKNTAKQQCPDCNYFTEVEIVYCNCVRSLSKIEVLQHSKRTISIAARSTATLSERIPVEDQNMVKLRGSLCSSKQKTCYGKQRRKKSDNSRQVASTRKISMFIRGARYL